MLLELLCSLTCRLGNHKILRSATTYWCPEREENGYMYSPVFKCSTNPRIATAHRWMSVDVLGCMEKPTGASRVSAGNVLVINILIECFYNKAGVWYYAGTYEAFQMEELSVKEWAQLSAEVLMTSWKFNMTLTHPTDHVCHCQRNPCRPKAFMSTKHV